MTICKAPNGLRCRVNIPKDRELYPLPCLLKFSFSSSLCLLHLLLNSVFGSAQTTHMRRTRSGNFRIRFYFNIRARDDLLSRIVQVHWVRWCAHRIDCNVQLRLICNCLMFLAAPVGRWASVCCISTNSNEQRTMGTGQSSFPCLI